MLGQLQEQIGYDSNAPRLQIGALFDSCVINLTSDWPNQGEYVKNNSNYLIWANLTWSYKKLK